jgi:hypothetical protein
MMIGTTLQATRMSALATAAGVLGAPVAAAAIWAVATAAGVKFTAGFGSGQPIEVTVVSVVAAALLASLAGWGLLVVLRRLTVRARTAWTVTVAVVALLSLGGPLAATASAATKLSLVAMHLTVATVLVAALRPTTR